MFEKKFPVFKIFKCSIITNTITEVPCYYITSIKGSTDIRIMASVITNYMV